MSIIAHRKQGEYVPDILEQVISASGLNAIDLYGNSEEGYSIHDLLNSDDKACWVSRQVENPSLLYYIPHKVFTLDGIGLTTHNQPQAPPLSSWALFGYDGTKWYLLAIRQDIDEMSKPSASYFFEVEFGKENKYHVLKLVGLAGQFSLAQVKFFGELEETDIEVDNSILTRGGLPEMKPESSEFPLVAEKKSGTFCPDIFKKAFNLYGPHLSGFVRLLSTNKEGCNPLSLFIGDKRKYWFSRDSQFPNVMFYFPEHAIKLTHYDLKVINGNGPHLTSWAVLGIPNDSDEPDLISKRVNCQEMTKAGACYSFPVEPQFTDTLYKAISIVSVKGAFGLWTVRLYGTVEESEEALSDDYLRSPTIPASVVSLKQ